ncbi:MAG: CBS domain-containing protein [Candidatus Binatia bacterium]
MRIEQWMKHPVQCVKPLDTIAHAREIMEMHRINQLPVIVSGRLVGIITDRDVREAYPSVFDAPALGARKPRPVPTSNPESVTVEMVMTPNVLTLGPHEPLVDAARLMRRERLGAVPIVDNGKLVGILARSDVLDAFVGLAASAARSPRRER